MIRAKHTIRHDNVFYAKGAIIDGLTEAEELRLVNLKAAEFVLSPEEELQKQRVENQKVMMPAEEMEELRMALDTEYNADDLKRTAKEVGVDLTGVSKKDDVIQAIIQQGKAHALLEDDADE